MRNKPRSLFDAIKQTQTTPDASPANVSSASDSKTEVPRKKIQPNPPASSVKASAPAPRSMPSAPPRAANFGLIVCVLLSFSVLTGLLGFVLGRNMGYGEGRDFAASLRSQKQVNLQSSSTLRNEAPRESEPVSVSETSSTNDVDEMRSVSYQLPVDTQEPAHTADVVVAEDQFNYTICVQYFGRGQRKEVLELEAYLKEQGFPAFSNPKKGEVYVGRFNSRNQPDAKKMQEKAKKIKWRRRNFSGCYFVNYP